MGQHPAFPSGFRVPAAAVLSALPLTVAADIQFSFVGDRFGAGPDQAVHLAAISADGTTAVGDIYDRGVHVAIRWREGTGVEQIGTLASVRNTYALAVNADGSVIGGSGDTPLGSGGFRWSTATGMLSVGYLAGAPRAAVTGVSADGNVVVGSSSVRGFRRSFSQGAFGPMQDLGLLPSGSYLEIAGVSADGSTVVGSANGSQPSDGTSGQGARAVRWTAQTGVVSLGLPQTPGVEDSAAVGISADGSVVAVEARGSTAGVSRSYLWRGGSYTMLDLLPGALNSRTLCLSPDGLAVGGSSGDPGGLTRSFFWSASTGTLDVDAFLRSEMPSLGALRVVDIAGIAPLGPDRWRIVGNMQNQASGRYVGFVATVPEPMPCLLLAFLGVFGRRRR